MRKLLFFVAEDWYFVSHRLPLAIEAVRQGYKVFVVTRCGGLEKTLRDAGLEVINFGIDRRSLNPLTVMGEALALTRIYRRIKPDIVHHVALKCVVIGAVAARLSGIKRVVAAIAGLGFLFTEQDRSSWVRRVLELLMRPLLSGAVTIVQNLDDRDALARNGVSPSRIHLLQGSGVDLDRFAVMPAPSERPVVMLASRLLWDKGVGEFIAAARELKDSEARFVLVGAPDPGNPASVRDNEIQAWVSEGIVEYWGYQSDMSRILPMANVVCLPSYREGLPKVLIEAMACGRPCVTTDVPGCRAAVRDGDNGLLVPPRDASRLAASIRLLLENAPLRDALGKRGRIRASAEFDVRHIVGETMSIYMELLRRDPAP